MQQAVIAIHGGAGTITRAAMDPAREREYTEALEHVLQAGEQDVSMSYKAVIQSGPFCM